MITFKSFMWPNDPNNLNITLSKKTSENSFSNFCQGFKTLKIFKIIEGSGDFLGPNCHKHFSMLSKIFIDPSPGKLSISGVEPINAFFSELSITGSPRPDIISYNFKFIENIAFQNSTTKSNNFSSYYLGENEDLWDVSRKFDMSIENLLKNNPLISSPYDISPGQKIIIS